MIYKKALETVEHWLDNKKIRIHCRTVCGGKCCKPFCEERCKRPPLPCATYLCDELLEKILGFHNGEKYKDLRNEIIRILVYAGHSSPPEQIDVELSLDIPDELIKKLLSFRYEADIHGKSI